MQCARSSNDQANMPSNVENPLVRSLVFSNMNIRELEDIKTSLNKIGMKEMYIALMIIIGLSLIVALGIRKEMVCTEHVIRKNTTTQQEHHFGLLRKTWDLWKYEWLEGKTSVYKYQNQ